MMYNVLIIGVLLGLVKCKENWDYLIFSQRWPITACTQWEDRSNNNTCAFPEPKNWWTVHGIWPTKEGTKGPWNCNATWHFNIDLLKPIQFELQEYWANVEGNTPLTSLWKHEWIKHGTCAATLQQLDNEVKYFNQGLKWIQKFNMRDVLSQKQIVPQKQGYSVKDVYDSVQSVLFKRPVIQCVIDKYTKQSLISEIRICFDRNLTLIDCGSVKDFDAIGNILTNCNVNKSIVYPDSILPYTTTTTSTTTTLAPTTTTEAPSNILYRTRERLLSLYMSLKLIIWFTM